MMPLSSSFRSLGKGALGKVRGTNFVVSAAESCHLPRSAPPSKLLVNASSSSSSSRGPAFFSSIFRGPSVLTQPSRVAAVANTTKNATKSAAGKSGRSFQSQSPTPPQGSSASMKVAMGLSGVFFICGLDFVAPTTFQKDHTYWNDQKAASHKGSKDRSRLLPTSSDKPLQYKFVIVGAGMAGLHTALALAERQPNLTSKDILVLDANCIGQSASGKSKGLVVPGIQVPQDELSGICGSSEIARQVYDLTYQAARRLKTEIVQRYQIDCGWVDAGLLEASLYEEEEEEDGEEEDDGCHALNASEVRQVLGMPNSSKLYKCGEYDASCSGVDPYALTTGLAQVVENKWGVRICEQTKVSKIDALVPQTVGNPSSSESPKYVVTTESGAQVQCQHVVLCTGPELVSKQLSKRLANAVTPIYTWMASTVPLGDQCPLQDGVSDEVIDDQNDHTSTKKTTPAPLCGDDFVSLNYWRRTNDGRILFGSLADAYPIPQWLAEYRLRHALKQIYPQLGNVKFDHVWGGRLAFSRDAVPLIGRDEGYDNKYIQNKPSDGGVWYATGFGGHGIVPTVMAGSVLADAMLGIDDNTWRLFQREFPPKYSFYPVSRLGAQALLTTYNVFDWLYTKGVPVPRLPKPW